MFMKFLGVKPERLGIVSSLYDQYTASHLTESLMNVYSLEKGKKGFQSINSFWVEWELKVNKIHKVPVLTDPSGDGANASDVIFYFPEEWYHKNDTFVVEKTRQQFIVINRPQRVRDACYLMVCKIVDNDYDSTVIAPAGGWAGTQTRFVTNYIPEIHKIFVS